MSEGGAWRIINEQDHLTKSYTYMNKFGVNPDLGTTEEDVWDGSSAYSFATAGETLVIFSTSAADTATGSGARTARVYGLSTSWLEQDETVTLNGTTKVTLANRYIRTYRVNVLTAGTSGSNVGTLDVTTTATAAAPVRARIRADEGSTLMAIYTLPANYDYGLLRGYETSCGKKSAAVVTARLRIRPFGGAWRTTDVAIVQEAGTSHIRHDFDQPARIEPKTDVKISAVSSSINTQAQAGFDILQIYPPASR